MITTALINVAYYILVLMLFIFPQSDGFPNEVQTAITTIGGYTTIINALVPMSVLGTIVGFVIAFEMMIWSWKGLRFLIAYIPFVGGRG